MNNKREETEKKYLQALLSLKNVLEYTDKISLREFARKNSVNTKFANVLVNGGILKHNGLRGSGAKYSWNTIDPNIKMAQEVLNRISKTVVTKETKKGAGRKNNGGCRVGAGRKTKEIENRYLKSYTTSFLWGLIKIKTKLNYEVGK
jgi:hypothetical protein